MSKTCVTFENAIIQFFCLSKDPAIIFKKEIDEMKAKL